MRIEFTIKDRWHRLSYCVYCNKTIWHREGTFTQEFVLRFDVQPWNICEDCQVSWPKNLRG